MPFPFSIPYPTQTHPSFYGPSTANTNFCELDFQFTPYVAELINTLSNAVYIIYATHGLRLLHHRNRLSPTTALPHLGLIAVGLGSASYHTTLLKVPQLADEIGMAVPTGAVVSRLLSLRAGDERTARWVYAASLGVVAAVYVVHCLTFSNWLHYPAFGGMVVIVGQECRRLIRGIEDSRVRAEVVREMRRGRALFLGAFAIWLVDRFCCAQLMKARNWLGLPWGWALELHGWWHVGTGMGAFVFIQVVDFLAEDGGRGDPGQRLNPFSLRVGGARGGERMVKVNGSRKSVGNGNLKAGERKVR